jgi:GDP-L-fucose synthase
MVGSACFELFQDRGFTNIITRARESLDLSNESEVNSYFEKEKPEVVIDAAARVGGIWANKEFPYEFLMENLLIQNNLIKASHENQVKKFIFLGSSCIYPKLSPQPIKEDYLLTAPLEPTNQWYAIAKITGVKLCEAIFKKYQKQFIGLMPTNLYGPNDNFDLKSSHVLPAMIRKFHEAKKNNSKEVVLWGDGSSLREFLHVRDLARAVLFSIENDMEETLYNVGSGKELSIKELASTIASTVGFNGNVNWDKSMPNGTPRKFLDSSQFLNLGWKPEISLKEGIKSTYKWYVENS